ncbi:MAG: DUF4157 domain-containing protein, partial [Acidobacteria bacterium]|nr:DUF4157 domain-containing protein [Acidobacteriota bacterium]
SPYSPAEPSPLMGHYSQTGNRAAQRLANPYGIPEPIKKQMESTFQTDFSDVTVTPNSSRAPQLGALAYTQGNEIHFAPGMYNPHTSAGQRLLGHELTHVVQQREGRVRPTGSISGKPLNDSTELENEADRMGIWGSHFSVNHAAGSQPQNTAAQSPIQGVFKKKGKKNEWEDPGRFKDEIFAVIGNKTIDDNKYMILQSANHKVLINQENKEFFMEIKISEDTTENESKKSKKGPAKPSEPKPEKPKMDLTSEVNKANNDLRECGEQDDFFEESGNNDNTVKIKRLQEDHNFHLDKMQARLANFSMSLLNYCRKKDMKDTPEIQTAVVKAPDADTYSIEISGNTKKSNKFLGGLLKENLGETYDKTIRLHHIEEKKKTMYEEAYSQLNDPDFQWDALFNPDVVSRSLHNLTKGRDTNLRRKSARAFVRKAWGPETLENAKIAVPENKDNLHAESAILKKLLDESNRIIESIGGTKVACTACQAYFTKENQHKLLYPVTSYAWTAKTSMAQLDTTDTLSYLKKIHELLKDRVANLKHYKGNSGTIPIKDMDLEDSPSDSEDDEAINQVAEELKLKTLAEKLAEHQMQKFQDKE